MAIKPKYQPKSTAETLAARRVELDWQQQMEAQRKESIAEQKKEHDAFLARVEAVRREQAQAREQGEQWIHTPIPTIDGVYAANAAEEQAAAEEAERQRIANLSPRAIWLSTLPFSERQRIATWESINRMQFPVPGLE